MYIPKTECLFPLDTWPEPSVGTKRDFDSEASTYLFHNDRLTTSMLYLVTLSPLDLLFYAFVHLTYFLSFSPPTPPFYLCPSGVSLHSPFPDSCTVHHFMQQVYDHRLGGWGSGQKNPAGCEEVAVGWRCMYLSTTFTLKKLFPTELIKTQWDI